MANKFLDENGLAHFWGKIKTLISGKQDELKWDSTPTKDSTNPVTSHGIYTALQNVGGNGGGDEEIIIVNCDIDLTTLQANNFSHSYQEIVNLVEAEKTVKLKCDYVAGICFGDLVVQNYAQNVVIFQIIIQMQIGTLYYINMMLSDSGVSVIPYLVQTSVVGG